MITHALILVLSITVLLAVSLPRPRLPRSLWHFAAAAFAGFALAQFALDGAFDLLGYERRTAFGRVNKGLLPHGGGKPRVLLVGSSYTARNVDGAALENFLRETGYDVSVLQLSSPGGYAFQQDYELSRYIKKHGAPHIALIELGTERFIVPAPENLFKHETISYHDTEHVVGILRIADAMDDATVGLSAAVTALAHGAAKKVHLGVLHAVDRGESVDRMPGFQPEPPVSAAFFNAAIHDGLASAEPQHAPHAAVLAFRQEQAKRLSVMGVKRVVFWQPPSADPVHRGRTLALCAALDPCLPFSRDAAMAGPYWNDANHLNQDGASRFTEILARQIIDSRELANVLR